MTRSFLRSTAVAASLLAALALSACSTSAPEASEAGGAEAEGLTLAAVQEAGVLTVGTEGTYRPFSFHAEGTDKLTGYDVEVVTAVAEKLGVDVAFEETQWDAIFAGLQAGRFDVIANQVTINDERTAKYDFSDPYTVSTGVIVVTDDNTDIDSFESLAGKRTAQSLTSNWYTLATESGAQVEGVEGWAQAVTLLEQGRVDATINDSLTFLDYQNEKGDTGLKIAAETEEQSLSALAFPKGSADLVEAVNAALAELQADGTLAEISARYFGTDVSQ